MSQATIIPPKQGIYQLQDPKQVRNSFTWEQVHSAFSWHQTGKVNMAHECIDRHVEEGFGNETALIFSNKNTIKTYSFADIKQQTDHWAAALKEQGVQKGDFVFVFLPKVPEFHIAMLAVIKLGAVVGPLFEAFMEDAVRDRMKDCQAPYLITDSDLLKRVPLQDLPDLKSIYVTDIKQDISEQIRSLPHLLQSIPPAEVTEWVDLEDGLHIHYTSGSTGKPKGVIHAHRNMIQHYQTGKWVLDLRPDDVYWCTAHPGWVTGTVYGVFAPWLNRVAIVVHGGRFEANDWYQLLEEVKVTVWYSAPTAFRMLMAEGGVPKDEYDLAKLRHVASVGEPLNPEVIEWGLEKLQVRIHDTWWMTETGAQLIANLPSQPIKPGSMGRALPGIEAAIIDDQGNVLPHGTLGHLAIKANWPSIMKEIWNNKAKYQSYFTANNWYVSGDLAIQDEDSYIFFNGRSDDMINSSGERIGPFEVESKLIEHPAVAEAGVIGKPDPLRGEIVKAFIVLRKGYSESPELLEDIRLFVRKQLAAHAAPREIEVLQELPKTQISGKILRRELKAREIEGISQKV